MAVPSRCCRGAGCRSASSACRGCGRLIVPGYLAAGRAPVTSAGAGRRLCPHACTNRPSDTSRCWSPSRPPSFSRTSAPPGCSTATSRAGCAWEMMQRGRLGRPVFNGELRTHKPVLLYWFIMSAYRVFGVDEFGARFWSAVLGVGTVLMTYVIGRRLFNPAAGLWAGLILSTTIMFGIAARVATPDSVLIFFSTASLLVFVYGAFGPGLPHDRRRRPAARRAARAGRVLPEVVARRRAHVRADGDGGSRQGSGRPDPADGRQSACSC